MAPRLRSSSRSASALLAAALMAPVLAGNDKDTSSSSVIIYVVIAVVVVFFLVVALFVWRRNRRRKQDQDVGLPFPVPGPSRQHGNNGRRTDDPYAPYPTPNQPGGGNNNPRRPNTVPAPGWEPPRRELIQAPPRVRPQVNNRVGGRQPDAAATQTNKEQALELSMRVMNEFRVHPRLGERVIPYSALYFTRVLNKGAFGEVWLAQWENKQVAVKRILNEKRYDEKEIEAFAAEIKLMASFEHPKIVAFMGVAWSDTFDMCAVTEYMAKGDLYGFLKRKGAQLNWRDHKIYLAEDAADAMGYLHSLSPKVIHRDLKSKNILLDEAFRAKLSDFGISRERSLEETMTAGVGTIYWTAPEVLMGKKYTEKADIYSFGIVMTELDTHEVPYSDMRDDAGKKLPSMKVVQMVIRKNLRPTFSDTCPPPVKELATRCLDADPDNRPDAFELLSRIQSVQDELTDV